MDYYNFNSGFTDSLDFLSPAAQKNARLSHKVFLPEYNCVEDVFYKKKQACFDQGCQKPSTTSLILKRTKNREVAVQNCYENIRYRSSVHPKLSQPVQNPIKNRPLIRVTVIPNNNTHTQSKLRKRKPITKKIQSTVSNHESFFKAKNIFLVVGSNKKEKIYEIKTTGSEYSNATRYAKNEEIPLEQNFQQFLNSLNMDKKKKKDKGKGKKEKDKKKEEDDVDEQLSGASLMNNLDFESPPGSILRDCTCSPAIDTVTPRKSRVTITGRIGRTEDDRYVLRCNATIDGKPVESNFYQEQNMSSSEWKAQEIKPPETKEIPKMNNYCSCIPSPRERIAYCQRESLTEKERFKVPQKDEMIQTAFQFEESYRQMPCPAYMKPCPAYNMTPCPAFRSVETQYSPRNVNAVCFSNVEKLNIYSSKDEVVQCSCPPDLLALSKDIGIEADYEVNSPKSCNSPLVIISVYPKQDSDDKYNDDSSSTKDTNSRSSPKEKVVSNKKSEKGGKKKQDKKPRLGSPTPPKSPVKGKEEKKVDKTKEKGKDKVGKNKQAKGNKKGPKKEKSEREKKEKMQEESRSPEKQSSTREFGTSFNRCAECCMGCIGSRNRQGTQDSNQMNRKRVMNWVSAKSDVSNVAINIDGENEFYDVLLRQGNITTDLQVRKTIKDAKFPQGPVDSGSLENFLLVTGDQTRTRNRSFSQTNFLDQQFADNTEMMDPSIPRLNVRDSIEISHRREEKNSCNSVTFTTSASSSSSSSRIKFAPIKHYKGDKCNLPNPIARDKEIRELLGIEKIKSKASRTYQEFAAKAEVDYNCSLHCFYRRQRKPNVNTIHNIHELRQLYTDDEVTQARYNDDANYLVDELGDSSDYNNDVYENIDMCRDSDIIPPKIQYSPITYGCKLGNRCPNKKDICEQEYKSDNKPRTESQIPRRIFKIPNFQKVCVSPQTNEDPCGVIVQCPYRKPKKDSSGTEEIEEEQIQPEVSAGEEEQQITKEDEETQEQTSNEQQQNQNAPLYQQLVLNRNINIYLQIEKFTKQKPIILSHKQYNKVKKTIESATGKKSLGKVMCICKPQSGEIKRKTSEKKKISNEQKSTKKPTAPEKVKCECGPPNKEIKKVIEADNSQSKEIKKSKEHKTSKEEDCTGHKCNKHKIASFYEPSDPKNRLNSDTCCTSDANAVDLGDRNKIRTEVLYMPSRTFDAHHKEIPTQTNQSKLFAEGLTVNNTATSQRYNDTKNNNNHCRNLIASKYHEEVYNAERVHRRTKAKKFDNIWKFEGTQARKTKHFKKDKDENIYESEKKQSRKTKRLEQYQDNGNNEKEQKTQRQKIKKDSRKMTRYCRGDESLEKKNCSIEYWKNECNESVSIIPQPVFGQEAQETLTAYVPRDQFCKRCGRLKSLNYSGNHGRIHNRRLQTCYCCELNDEVAESSLENNNFNSFIKDKRYAASSTEVRYTSVIYANYKHVTFSSVNVAKNNVSMEEPYAANLISKDYNSSSLHTIFKRPRRSPTPNLGTSAYSLCSKYTDATNAGKVGTPTRPAQGKKPFLRRLMSCLVMRSKTSGVKIDVKPAARWNSANSSVDSYHINTSLGAVELSSSIYDTSASFYSNHSIQPISSKIIKRGFLSSVRGFLTNRKV